MSYVASPHLQKYMPNLASVFSHVLVDVSSVKALCVRWYPRGNTKNILMLPFLCFLASSSHTGIFVQLLLHRMNNVQMEQPYWLRHVLTYALNKYYNLILSSEQPHNSYNFVWFSKYYDLYAWIRLVEREACMIENVYWQLICRFQF